MFNGSTGLELLLVGPHHIDERPFLRRRILQEIRVAVNAVLAGLLAFLVLQTGIDQSQRSQLISVEKAFAVFRAVTVTVGMAS